MQPVLGRGTGAGWKWRSPWTRTTEREAESRPGGDRSVMQSGPDTGRLKLASLGEESFEIELWSGLQRAVMDPGL